MQEVSDLKIEEDTKTIVIFQDISKKLRDLGEPFPSVSHFAIRRRLGAEIERGSRCSSLSIKL
jgi:hypothetical protein